MKKARLHIALTGLLLLCQTPICAAGAGGWESVKSEVTEANSIVKEQELEIMTAPATIIVRSSQPVQIKVFTILGRLVSSETLPAGVSQLSVGAHGVYIIKVGELTCKVAI